MRSKNDAMRHIGYPKLCTRKLILSLKLNARIYASDATFMLGMNGIKNPVCDSMFVKTIDWMGRTNGMFSCRDG